MLKLLKFYSIFTLILYLLLADLSYSFAVDEYLNVPFNLSVYPGLSIGESIAKGKKIRNNFCLGIFGSQADQLNGVSISGLWNEYTEDSKGVEIGGIWNINKKDYEGIQIGGFNRINGNFSGFQIGYYGNRNFGLAEGVQIGSLNENDSNFKGIQICCGNYNHGTFRGVQIAAIANFNYKEVEGIQLSGLINMTQLSYSGVSITGGFNVFFSDLLGVEISGLANFNSNKMTGVQIAGLANINSSYFDTVQIAPFNFSEYNNGIPIGLISYVKEYGFHMDAWGDENRFGNIGLRSGNKLIHSVLFLGLQPLGSAKWTIGGDIGVRFLDLDKFGFDADASYQHISDKFGKFTNKFNSITRLKLLANYQVTDFMSIFAGPTFNYYFSLVSDGSGVIPWHQTYMQNCSCSTLFWQITWFGFEGGIRF